VREERKERKEAKEENKMVKERGGGGDGRWNT
jgi:hypothetical protein